MSDQWEGLGFVEEPMDKFSELGFVEEKISKKKPSKTSGVKEFSKQAAIGAAQGALGSFGDIFSILGLGSEEMLPGQRAVYEAESRAQTPFELSLYADDDLAPRYHRLPRGSDIRQLLSAGGIETEPSSAAGRYGERIGQALGGGAVLGAPLASLPAIGGAAALGQSVEEVAGPGAGLAVELGALLAPQMLGKKLAVGAKQRPIVEAAKRAGVTEKELAPILKPKFARQQAAKLAQGPRGEKIAEKVEEGLGRGYQNVRQKAAELGAYDPGAQRHIVNEIGNARRELGVTLKGTDKAKVAESLADIERRIAERPTSPADLLDYWQEINSSVKWNAVKGGKKGLAQVKKIFGTALKESSPELFQEFQSLNQLYPVYKDLAKSLKGEAGKGLFKGKAELFGAYQLLTGNLTGALKTFGLSTAGKAAALEYLKSTRTQGMLRKAVNLANRGKLDQARAIAATIDKEIRQLDQE